MVLSVWTVLCVQDGRGISTLSTFLIRGFSNRFHGSVERLFKKLYHIFKCSLPYCTTIPLIYMLYQRFMPRCPIVGVEIMSKYWSLLEILWILVFWQFEIHFFYRPTLWEQFDIFQLLPAKRPNFMTKPRLLQDAFDKTSELPPQKTQPGIQPNTEMSTITFGFIHGYLLKVWHISVNF